MLGPMVVTVTAFDVPDGKADCSLWEILKDAVSDGLKGKGGRLAVCDSKKVYNAQRGLKPLEETVLSFLRAKDSKAASFLQFQQGLSCCKPEILAGYPWYAGKDFPLPAAATKTSVLNYADLLQCVLDRQGVRFCHASSRVVAVREFNEQARLLGNKSHVLFDTCAALISGLWNISGGYVRLTVDKQGGRNSYAGLLKEYFPRTDVKVLKEGNDVSRYEVSDARRRMEIAFTEKGEEASMAAALASMFSKYTRELFMRLENQYWLQFLPGLKPTAGYYEDAQRFLSDISGVRNKAAIQDEILIRIK